MLDKRSEQKLATCNMRLIKVITQAANSYPGSFIVVWGHRDREAQEEAFRTGHSKKHWPNGRHNSMPSNAVDLAPLSSDGKSIPWTDIQEFEKLAYFVLGVAAAMSIDIQWGGFWTHLHDYGHFELKHDIKKAVEKTA